MLALVWGCEKPTPELMKVELGNDRQVPLLWLVNQVGAPAGGGGGGNGAGGNGAGDATDLGTPACAVIGAGLSGLEDALGAAGTDGPALASSALPQPIRARETELPAVKTSLRRDLENIRSFFTKDSPQENRDRVENARECHHSHRRH